MKYSTKRRVVLGMTTGGLVITSFGMANAHADTTASGGTTRSPGVGSGNLIHLPVNAPINVCGNQLDVIGILDSVTGNTCENSDAPASNGGSTAASGTANGSPGVGSGNLIQVPVNAPINICGNQLDVIGIGDSDRGNSCENHGSGSTTASGGASGSPGIVAGDLIEVPVNAPMNVCGNQLDVIGILDSVVDNSCENNAHGTPVQPSPPPTGATCGCPTHPTPPPRTPRPPSRARTPTPVSSPSSPAMTPFLPPSMSGRQGGAPVGHGGSSGTPTGVLAHTGSAALAVAPVGASLIGGGVLLRRRFFIRSR